MSDVENCGHGHAAPRKMLAELPESQAGSGRHKCAICAYRHGFQAGLRKGLRCAQDALAGLAEGDAAGDEAEGG